VTNVQLLADIVFLLPSLDRRGSGGCPSKPDENLAVPLLPSHGGFEHPQASQTQAFGKLQDLVGGLEALTVVAHDPSSAHPAATNFELRLH
jgi:hypothetical protein